MTIENPMLNKKSSLLNIKQKVDEKSTGQEFIENKNTDINVFDLINKPKLKEEKVMIGIKLKKEIADKVKSFSYENNYIHLVNCEKWKRINNCSSAMEYGRNYSVFRTNSLIYFSLNPRLSYRFLASFPTTHQRSTVALPR